jgi:endo-1,4-beta-xylanase
LQGTGEAEVTTPPNPQPGQRINSIKNIHNPSIEAHLPPAEKANGTAIIVAPGGGHREVNVGTEGTDIAKWLNDLGIAAFVLKYRLAQTPGYHYTVEGEALQDTQRAIRIVRARAKQWNVNPDRIGILGFSAGGALAALSLILFVSSMPVGRPIWISPRRKMRPRHFSPAPAWTIYFIPAKRWSFTNH